MCVECAKKVTDLLDQMEKGGEWRGLSDDEKEIERQTMGLRIRAGIECPKEATASVDLTRNEASLLYEMIDTRIQNIALEGIGTTASARAFRDGLRKKLADAICEVSK